MRTLVIVGHGMVGNHLLQQLREHDRTMTWRIIVLAEEDRPAYDRVALSSFLEDGDAQKLDITGPGPRSDPRVDLRLATPAAFLDRRARTVICADGTRLHYDALVLATGSRPFIPPVPGRELFGCFVHRTFRDVRAIRAAAAEARSGVVIGGGLLGLEAASALRVLGMRPHVVESASHLMPAQIDGPGGLILGRLVSGLGVRVHCGAELRRVVAGRNGRVHEVCLADGTTIDTDLVVFSAGVRPRDELASDAELGIGERGGFLVDARCRTEDSRIWAIGECAAVRGRCYGLVGPGYRMAESVVRQLLDMPGEPLEEIDTSAALKLVGVDVASFGDAHGRSPGALGFAHADEAASRYAKLTLSPDGRTLLGGVLVGSTTAYPALRALLGRELPCAPEHLLGITGR